MKHILILFILLCTTTTLVAQAPIEDNGQEPTQIRIPSGITIPNSGLRIALPNLHNTHLYRHQEGWTAIESFIQNGKTYLFYLSPLDHRRFGSNAQIRPVNADGSIGEPVKSYKWSEGWTAATFYYASGKLHLMLVKKRGYSSSGNNVHCHRMNPDGSVGPKVKSYSWTEGWTNFSYYRTNQGRYMLSAKSAGFGNSGNNVHVRKINNDGTFGSIVKSYGWTEGWDTFETYKLGNGTTLLIQAKSRGAGGSGNNVHIRKINSDGSVGSKIASYRWSEGVGALTPYSHNSSLYMLHTVVYPASSQPTARIRKVNNDGTLSNVLKTYNWPSAWTYYTSMRAGGKNYIVSSRREGFHSRANIWVFEPR